MQYWQRRLQRSVTEIRRLRSGRPMRSWTVGMPGKYAWSPRWEKERWPLSVVRFPFPTAPRRAGGGGVGNGQRITDNDQEIMPVVIETITSEVLKGNALGDPHERRVPIYVPPDYDGGDRRYPVVYFLAGFSNGGVYLLGESLWGETLPQRVDRLVRSDAIRPLIMVMADCVTRLGGSQYINSAATGRYADHLIDELIPYVDARYR